MFFALLSKTLVFAVFCASLDSSRKSHGIWRIFCVFALLPKETSKRKNVVIYSLFLLSNSLKLSRKCAKATLSSDFRYLPNAKMQKWPGKMRNVASETLEKNDRLAAFEMTVLSRPVALKPSTLQLCKVEQLDWWTPLETLKRHPISCPKLLNCDREKFLTWLLKPYKKRSFGCLWDNLSCRVLSLWRLQPCNFAKRTPFETVKCHLISTSFRAQNAPKWTAKVP